MTHKHKDYQNLHEKRKQNQFKQGYPYRNKNPSEVTQPNYLYASRSVGEYPDSTERSGKWLIFIPNADIDIAWKIVKEATQNGLLGKLSKVSTIKKNPIANNTEENVICVYTYDWNETEDVMGIRESLRKLGFTQELVYKTDKDTMEGKYSWKGDYVAKYIE